MTSDAALPLPPPDLGLRRKTPLRGKLIRRYKRFFADIQTDAGEELTVYCPDPGRMRTLAIPGAPVRCSASSNPKRKLRYTLEMIRQGRTWVGTNPMLPNRLIKTLLQHDALAELRGYATHRREVPVPGGSRLDFLLTDHSNDPRPSYLEIKSVSFAEQRGGKKVARFPDAVTTRGTRHLETLQALHAKGSRAVLLFVVQRDDCDFVEAAEEIDPKYASALREAKNSGVELLAIRTRVRADGLFFAGELDVRA